MPSRYLLVGDRVLLSLPLRLFFLALEFGHLTLRAIFLFKDPLHLMNVSLESRL